MASTIPFKPILKYPGAKWSRARWITSLFPAHEKYLEPYCGSAACFFSKEPASHEVLGDTNRHLINLFQVIRDHGLELAHKLELTGWIEEEYLLYERDYGQTDDRVENARQFLVRCWQAHGTKLGSTCGWRHKGVHSDASTTSLWKQLPGRIMAIIDRLRDAEIRCQSALELVQYYKASNVLIYADPPYMPTTRTYDLYEDEMTEDEHKALLEVLDKHPGPVILSGYTHPLYDDVLSSWGRITMPSHSEKGGMRTEVLWLNAKAAQARQLHLFAGSEALS